MLGLYRAGRQSDALAAFQRARAVLREELGLQPGPALRDLEQAVLDQRPELLPPVGAAPSTPRPPSVAYTPPRRRGLVGRSLELAELHAAMVEAGEG